MIGEVEVSPPSSPIREQSQSIAQSYRTNLFEENVHNMIDDPDEIDQHIRHRVHLLQRENESDEEDSRYGATDASYREQQEEPINIEDSSSDEDSVDTSDQQGDYDDEAEGKNEDDEDDERTEGQNIDNAVAGAEQGNGVQKQDDSDVIIIEDEEGEIKDDNQNDDIVILPGGETSSVKGATRSPRYLKLGMVDGMITVLEDPFTDEEETKEDDTDDDTDDDPNEAIDRADLLVKPNKKKQKHAENAVVGKEGESANAEDLTQLVEMRGEGRYFGFPEEEGNRIVRLCINCHKPGHMHNECKTIVCQTCGEQDDHITRNCPKTRRCSNCNKLGHSAFECKEKRKTIYCSRCRSSRHSYETCPSIWCCYSMLRNKPKPLDTMFCYNCGEAGHYGDDCKKPRPMMQPLQENSVFSVVSLPKGYALSTKLQKLVDAQSSRKSRSSQPARSSNNSYRPSLEDAYRRNDTGRDSYRPDNRDSKRGTKRKHDDMNNNGRGRDKQKGTGLSSNWFSRKKNESSKKYQSPPPSLINSDSRYDFARNSRVSGTNKSSGQEIAIPAPQSSGVIHLDSVVPNKKMRLSNEMKNSSRDSFDGDRDSRSSGSNSKSRKNKKKSYFKEKWKQGKEAFKKFTKKP
ncbi:hypothetical protein V1511DRAFT_497163 [Dipodascopsis uninucleata]